MKKYIVTFNVQLYTSIVTIRRVLHSYTFYNGLISWLSLEYDDILFTTTIFTCSNNFFRWGHTDEGIESEMFFSFYYESFFCPYFSYRIPKVNLIISYKILQLWRHRFLIINHVLFLNHYLKQNSICIFYRQYYGYDGRRIWKKVCIIKIHKKCSHIKLLSTYCTVYVICFLLFCLTFWLSFFMNSNFIILNC